MAAPKQPEPVTENASLDDALAAAIRNAGRARDNVSQLTGLQDFITRTEAVK